MVSCLFSFCDYFCEISFVQRRKKNGIASQFTGCLSDTRDIACKQEKAPKNDALSGIPERPNCKGRAYDPDRYNR